MQVKRGGAVLIASALAACGSHHATPDAGDCYSVSFSDYGCVGTLPDLTGTWTAMGSAQTSPPTGPWTPATSTVTLEAPVPRAAGGACIPGTPGPWFSDGSAAGMRTGSASSYTISQICNDGTGLRLYTTHSVFMGDSPTITYIFTGYMTRQ